MGYFDHTIDRAGTASVKYDLRKERFGREDILPMWVADMDFPAPREVTEQLINRAKHPIYGYSILSQGYYNSIVRWMDKRHGWPIDQNWIVFSPGIVTALNLLVETFTQPGDAVIVQPPVYFPFFHAVEKNGRKVLYNQLINEGDRYVFDFEDLENKVRQGAKMLILCSPHNPVCRVWTKEELEKVTEICLESGVLIVSDEIHHDLVFSPHRHIPTASLSGEIARNTITCIAPSKTFNLAGLATSSIIIADQKLRERFNKTLERVHFGNNLFGAVASEAAYTYGEPWLDELLSYLQGNISLIRQFFDNHDIPVRLTPVESTFLAWLDFRQASIPPKTLNRKLVEVAGLGLVDGRIFGPGGEGFQRLNFGCPSKSLKLALFRLSSIW